MAATVPLPGEMNRAAAVRSMFDRIAPTYDLLNRVLALRVDVRWRRRMVESLEVSGDDRVLDLCAGTMDVAAVIHRKHPDARVAAADFSLPMLALGVRKTHLPATASDALAIPFRDAAFDAATVAFGVRNLDSADRGLRELHRVLKPGGRLAILEFFKPESGGARLFHNLYNRAAIPTIGRVLSRDDEAYRYLVASIEAFSSRPDFEAAVRIGGFTDVRGETLFPGVCGLVTARRSS